MAPLMKLLPLSRRAHTIAYTTCALTLLVVTLSSLRNQSLTLSILPTGTPSRVLQKANTTLGNESPSLPLPTEYEYTQEHSKYCADRYQRKYLEHLRDSAVGYCSDGSAAQLDCFHSSTAPNRIDTFCYGTNAVFNTTKHTYELPCSMRPLSQDELDHGVPPVSSFAEYWYSTGPKHVFDKAIVFSDSQRPPIIPFQRPISILVKREGEGNLWHFWMVIFAVSMTIDVLRSSVNPHTGMPFLSETDKQNTQVVLVDNHLDGPYFELWNLFTQKPAVRIKDIAADSVGDIIVPLAGGGNPFWQGDWEPRPCEASELLRVFATRVLEFFSIRTSPREGTIRVTWVNRIKTRRLIDQERLLEAVRARIPHIDIQSVDLAGMPFREQIQLIRDTDVLMGVHGAGLTHVMWLRPGSVIAEILPSTLNFKGFRNLAALLGLDYYSIHGIKLGEEEDWNNANVQLREDNFVSLVESAVRSTYKKGLRDFDIL